MHWLYCSIKGSLMIIIQEILRCYLRLHNKPYYLADHLEKQRWIFSAKVRHGFWWPKNTTSLRLHRTYLQPEGAMVSCWCTPQGLVSLKFQWKPGPWIWKDYCLVYYICWLSTLPHVRDHSHIMLSLQEYDFKNIESIANQDHLQLQ